ncbi:protein canopy homolog 2 [Fopius arisanus]|uniref:Cnpy2_1 protein n=2 Tax=Fopius arisanus TaxID=64838 RepID=A0A0C9RKH5_9HYME|nr:PREDICTED: protein canopy homolog 2 [Fopius arisanus]
MKFIFLLGVFILPALVSAYKEIDMNLLQCLICRTTIEEMDNVMAKIDPSRSIDVGNYRLDAQGNILKKSVPMRKSEVHISEVLDNICNKLDDYVRARYKSNGRLILMPLEIDGQMNPEIGDVDIIQDGDLNRSLKYYCQELVDEYEEPIIKGFQKGGTDVINEICTKVTNVCDDELPPEDGDEESSEADRDEL